MQNVIAKDVLLHILESLSVTCHFSYGDNFFWSVYGAKKLNDGLQSLYQEKKGKKVQSSSRVTT